MRLLKKITVFSLLFLSLAGMLFAAGDLRRAKRARIAAGVYGKIYVTDLPSHADFLVYVSNTESLAELRVRKISHEWEAQQPGQWCFVDLPSHADWQVCFTNEASSDFGICYVSTGEGVIP